MTRQKDVVMLIVEPISKVLQLSILMKSWCFFAFLNFCLWSVWCNIDAICLHLRILVFALMTTSKKTKLIDFDVDWYDAIFTCDDVERVRRRGESGWGGHGQRGVADHRDWVPPGDRLHQYHREHVRVRDDEHVGVYHGQHDVQQDGGDNVQ